MLQRTQGSTTTDFHWDGWDLIREEKDDGVDVEVTNYLVPHGEILAFERDDEWFYLHGDGLSSTQLVTDDTGAQAARIVYGAWGEELSVNDSVPGGLDVRFVGGLGVRNDSASGLIYMRHRWYDASLGRFLSRDPIGLDGGHNLYEYGASSPNNSVDPDGLNPITWWIWESTVPGPYGNPEPTKWGTVSDIGSWNDLIDYVCQHGTGAERTIFMSSLVTGVSATTIAVMVGLGQASGRIPQMVLDGKKFGKNGGRLFQIRPNVGRGQPKKVAEGIFRLDYHQLPGGIKKVLHYHMKPDMSLHRLFGLKEAGAAAGAMAVYVVAVIKCKPEKECG